MNHWLENSEKNLVPLSVAATFREALREWAFTGNVLEHEDGGSDIICALCERSNLSYHYEIKNKHNGHELLVGSSCLLKFEEIEIINFGGAVVTDRGDRRLYLDVALSRKLREDSLQPLRELWRKDAHHRRRIEESAKAIKQGEGVSPNELLFIFRKMQEWDIPFRAKLYKISLRALHEPVEMFLMDNDDRTLLKPAFSREQLKRNSQLFNTEPSHRAGND